MPPSAPPCPACIVAYMLYAFIEAFNLPSERSERAWLITETISSLSAAAVLTKPVVDVLSR